MDVPQSSSAEERQPLGRDDLPLRRVTMNQVVAHNIAYFRNALSLTQEELGSRLERITGKRWSKATMSAVERSWDGNRIRSFDADDLMALSQALEVPVTALFLPPEEDGTVIDYVFTNVGSSPYRDRLVKGGGTGAELLAQLFASEYDYMRGGDAFLERLQEALDFYYGAVPEDFFITRPPEPIDEHVAVDEQVNKLRRQIATLREVMATLDRAANKLEGPDSPDGPERTAPSDGPDPEDVALFDERAPSRKQPRSKKAEFRALGEMFNRARNRSGASFRDIEKSGKFPPFVAQKIEMGYFDHLGGDAKVRGYLRSYASLVGLVPEEVLSTYFAALELPDEE